LIRQGSLRAWQSGTVRALYQGHYTAHAQPEQPPDSSKREEEQPQESFKYRLKDDSQDLQHNSKDGLQQCS
jgi:hypothetical protein